MSVVDDTRTNQQPVKTTSDNHRSLDRRQTGIFLLWQGIRVELWVDSGASLRGRATPSVCSVMRVGYCLSSP